MIEKCKFCGNTSLTATAREQVNLEIQQYQAMAEDAKWQTTQLQADFEKAVMQLTEQKLENGTLRAEINRIKKEWQHDIDLQKEYYKEIEQLKKILKNAISDLMMICPGPNRNNAIKNIKRALESEVKSLSSFENSTDKAGRDNTD